MGLGINALTKKWTNVDVSLLVRRSLEAQTETLAEFQIGQLITGVNREGTKIGKYKDQKHYAKYKFNLNTLAGYGFVDLRVYGDYYAGMVAKVTTDRVMFYSKDEKNDELNKKYDPLGLNSTSIGTFNEQYLAPEFQKQLDNELRRL